MPHQSDVPFLIDKFLKLLYCINVLKNNFNDCKSALRCPNFDTARGIYDVVKYEGGILT